MTFAILLEVFLLGIGLSADAFSVALVDGLTMRGITKKRYFFVAGSFGIMQGLMPLVGFWLVEAVERIAGDVAGAKTSEITAKVVVWVAFVLLLFVGIKMLIESIFELKKPVEEKKVKEFSYKNVLLYSFLTAIDALASGVALHAGLSNASTIWLHVAIIAVTTFALSLVGLFLGKQVMKLLKGRPEISGIIGGIILILLAIWIVLGHYLGI